MVFECRCFPLINFLYKFRLHFYHIWISFEFKFLFNFKLITKLWTFNTFWKPLTNNLLSNAIIFKAVYHCHKKTIDGGNDEFSIMPMLIICYRTDLHQFSCPFTLSCSMTELSEVFLTNASIRSHIFLIKINYKINLIKPLLNKAVRNI